MKILFLSRLFHPHIGGVERHIYEISSILVKDGHEVTVVTTKFDDKLSDLEFYNGIKIIRFNQPKIKFIGLIYTWLWILRNFNLIKESDVLHVHDVFIWYLPFKFIVPKKKIYATLHGWEGKYPLPLNNKMQKKLSAKLSDGVVVIGEYINKHYEIETDLVSYGGVTTPGSFPDLKLDNQIVFVGRLDKDTGLNKAFKFFIKADNYKIIFCGDGELRHEAGKYGEVKGFVNPARYYQKSKYCFASGYLTILEALANKCIVFAIYENKLKEDYFKLSPFYNFINVSNDPNELFNRLNYFEKNPKASKKLVEKGYEWVKTQTWENLVDKYLDLWRTKS